MNQKGLGEFKVIDLMEWFMKSMIDVLSAFDECLNTPTQEWPRCQDLKKIFTDIVKPMEHMVAHLYPLPPYQTMR